MGAPNTMGTPAGFTFPSPAPSAPRSVVDPDDVFGYGTQGTQGDAGDGDGNHENQRTLVWGTTVEVREDGARFKRFLEFFELPNRPDLPHYHRALVECFERENYQLDLDCQHLEAYDPGLYNKLVSYPQEMVPLFDQVANEHFAERVLPPGEELFTRVQVRTFNLKETRAMRDLNPSDIDKLVAVRGMVTRCSSVIPDLKMAYFKCLVCGDAPDLTFVDRGRVNEPPLKCRNADCESIGTMTLVHNRCVFANKQQIKMQETPDAIPEGETPHTVSMCVFDSLVDEAKPGDRVEITGVYRAVPIRAAPNMRILKAVYKTYVDVIHVRKDASHRIANTAGREDREDLEAEERRANAAARGGGDDAATENAENSHPDAAENPPTSSLGPGADAEFSPERVAFLERVGKADDVYERLVSSLAPSIWEMEEVKKGLLCQLFGATHKTFKGTNANKVRGDINVILVGDPGVSKSQLLTYVNKVAPRGIYTSGRGSSAVGLTAYVTRDPESKDMVLESGALVLSDRGICCIDEFDKMSDGARSTLHEVMEQQTVSVAKAGIIAVLNARTSVLASANPVGSRYNPAMSVIDNIQLPPTLLSRFDLIYLVLDKPNPETDRRLARHLVSLHFRHPPARATGALDATTLTDYISYARKTYTPVLNDEAAEMLVEGYVDMRRLGGGRRTITATPRQLESLVRLAESLARMRLSHHAEARDAAEALRLMRVAMQQAAWDPKTGQIDMDKILTGHSASDRRHRAAVAEGIAEILAESGSGRARLGELVSRLKERNSAFDMSVQDARDAAMLLVEQDRATIKGDMVAAV
jgi:DNA replication licensing factor MCM4